MEKASIGSGRSRSSWAHWRNFRVDRHIGVPKAFLGISIMNLIAVAAVEEIHYHMDFWPGSNLGFFLLCSFNSLSYILIKTLHDSEVSLRRQDAHVHALFSQSRDAITTIKPPSWNFTSCNQAALELYGVQSMTEFQQYGPWSFSPPKQPDGEDSATKARRMIEKALAEGSHFFEWQHTKLDGTPIPCSVLLSKVEFEDECLLQATIRNITVEKSQEKEIKEVHRALEQAAIVATTDKFGKIVNVNDKFEQISGFVKSELVGREHLSILSNLDSKDLFEDIDRTLKSGRPWNGAIRNQGKNGKTYTVQTVVVPLRNIAGQIDRFIWIQFDITEQVKLQNYLDEAQKIARIGHWYYDVSTHRVEWSRYMFDLFEVPYQQGPLEFKDHISSIHPEDLLFWKNLVDTCIQDGKPYQLRFRRVLPKGIMWVDTHGYAVQDKDGKVIGITGTCQDISEKVATEKDLEQQRIKTIHSAKLASLGEMSAGIAHEINNPLAVINGSLSLIRRLKNDEIKLEERIAIMKKAVHRISKIVNGLRKFSRSTSTTEASPNAIIDIINEAAVITETKSKRHTTSVDFDLKSNSKVLCDAIEIEQVIINLINNAIDAVKDLEDRWVKVRLYDVGDEVVIQVIDSGSGIPKEIEEKLFQPFFTTKPVGEGTGLGLSICKGILDHHKAKFFINHDTTNTCFEIRFKTLSEVSHAV